MLFLITSCFEDGDSSGQSTSESQVSSDSTEYSMAEPPKVSESKVQEEIEGPVKSSTIPDICTSKYGYYQLNADEKAVYDQLVDAARTFKPSVELCREVSKDQLKRICNIMYIEENDLYYLTDEYELSRQEEVVNTVFLSYLYDKETVERMNVELDQKLQLILDKVTPEMSTVDKIKLFHDRIIYDCVYYSDAEYKATPYGALVDGGAVCEGYARAFAILCNKAGIENVFACGSVMSDGAELQQHMWNMVKVNGAWYNIDVTADDPNAPADKEFLGYDYIQYNYFLFPTSQLSCSRSTIVIDDSLYKLPDANSMGANYFVYYGYYADTYDEGIDILSKSIENAVKSQKKYVRLRFSNEQAYDEAIQKLFKDKEIFSLEARYGLPKVNLWRAKDLMLFQLELVYDDEQQ